MSRRTTPQPTPTPEADHGGSASSRPGRTTWWLLAAVVVAVLAWLALDRYVVTTVTVVSGSMEPALEPGDRVLVDRLGAPEDLARGDVVVLDGLSWGGGSDVVKRVIGLPGERVSCCDESGRLTVDGRPLDEPWLAAGEAPSDIRFDVVVPADHLWLLGDHRSVSDDSRHHLGDPGGGFVPVADVVGRVWVRYWPLQRLGSLDPAPTDTRGAGAHG